MPVILVKTLPVASGTEPPYCLVKCGNRVAECSVESVASVGQYATHGAHIEQRHSQHNLSWGYFYSCFKSLCLQLQVCQPVMKDGSTCANETNAGKYITDFTCAGEGSSNNMLREMRLSFPSGHSSFTFYTMVYVAVSCILFVGPSIAFLPLTICLVFCCSSICKAA